MYKVYDPFNGFRIVARVATIQEAFAIAKNYANETKREQWVDTPSGIFAGMAKPAPVPCR